ncbi:hypothetical protein GCM10025789_01970 [Tessaracoccus lubricantis]|uniref:Inner membrane protein YgaP-like transmembrane domain-containing protein n=1 Tax=Tessaracoccus lubricantis TaxID=545543 RepID=A0ABP9EZE4_9ACTN
MRTHVSTRAEAFNRSGFGVWINSPTGRVFRVVAGTAFLTAGFATAGSAWGVASIVWGILPLTAGLFDVCYISAALGGPLRGGECRAAARTPG